MLGVFKKRWKPKNRVAKSENGDDLMLSCGNEYSEPINAYVLPDSRISKLRSPRQMFSACDNNSHYSVTYETLKPVSVSSDTASAGYGKLQETVPPPIGGAPGKMATIGGGNITTPNICIEGGRIEFVKSPVDCGDEKQDYLKEYMEAKIVQLESELVAERRITQRERTLNSKLQKQLARREWLQRDVDRERRLRLDTEARLKGSSSEADRCRIKLSTLQKDFTKMEDTVRSLLQYKSKFEQLKQDRHSVANSYENQILQLQNAITKLKIENETLKKQIDTLEATGISQVQKALVERLRILEHEKSRIEREGEQQRKQYERCLDDVAKQVVKAVLSQKGLREEISSLQHRVKELETGNCALSALLVQRLQQGGQKINYSPTTMPVAESRSVMFDIHRSPSVKMAIERPASCDLTKGLKRLKNDGWQAAVSYHRPQSLNLEICCSHNAEESTKCDSRVLGDETPESGNRDEGYSTMSSDVQGTAEPPSTKGLEDVKEANENESNALMESSPCSRVMNSEDTDVIFVPLSLSFSFINPRHSYPPLRCMPAMHNIMRSYSDSHLFLKLAAASGGFVEDEDRTSWYSGGELWDMDYVQHWLRLDETRTAIQQRMEYDAAELEDWSMDDGTGTATGWKRMSAVDGKLQQSLPCIEEDDATGSSSTSCGRKGDLLQDMGSSRDMSWYHFQQQHHTHQHHHQHPYVQQNQIQVHNLHQHDCQQLQQQQHHHNHHLHQHQQQQPSYGSGSPGGDSWSSADEYAAADTPPSKRSSVSCSADSIELLPPPGPIAGTDFTRDFYRLVKFESSKSLASTSSRSVTGGGCDHRTPPVIEAQLDRDQALQSVLDFIAEQQQYCLSRQAEDKREPPRAPSPAVQEVEESRHSDEPAADVRPQTPPPLPALPISNPTPPGVLMVAHQTYDSNSCSDNLLNSKDSGLCGSDVEIECLPEDCSYVADQSPTAASTPLSTLLRTVVEEDEEASAKSTSPQPPSSSAGADGSSSGCTADTAVCMVTAWAAASSKDLIDQLNWMDDGCGGGHPLFGTSPEDDVGGHRSPSSSPDLDEACCCPTGWVHVERDIDFADPKERANLLDVMLASSRSSSSSTSSASTGEDDDDDDSSCCCSSGVSGGSCGGRAIDGRDDTTDDSSDDERDPNDDEDSTAPAAAARPVSSRRRTTAATTEAAGTDASNEESYNRLHKLHRVRRQKKASAIRDGFGVLRCPAAGLRQSIVGRSDFFVRFGDKEREAISKFDFLDDLSTTSLSTDSGDRPPSPRRPADTASTSAATAATAASGNRHGKYYSYTCSSSATAAAANAAMPGHRRPSASSSSVMPADCRRQRRRRYSGLSLSDSCGDSD